MTLEKKESDELQYLDKTYSQLNGKLTLVFTITVFVSLLLFSAMANEMPQFLGHPQTVLIFPFSFILLGMSTSIKSGAKKIMGRWDHGNKAFLGVLKDDSRALEIHDKFQRKLPVTNRFYVFIFLFILVLFLFTLFIELTNSILMGHPNPFSLCAEISAWLYWTVAIPFSMAQYNFIRKLIEFGQALFDEDEDFSILEFQKKLFERETSPIEMKGQDDEEGPSSAQDYHLELSHQGFRRIAIHLARHTRGLIIVVVTFALEGFLMVSVINPQGLVLSNAFLNRILTMLEAILVIVPLLIILVYIELEFAIHDVLYQSKKNLVAVFDVFLLENSVGYISSPQEEALLKKKAELSKELVSYSSGLSTWSFDSGIALGVAGGLIIQGIITIIRFAGDLFIAS